ncbi:NitT/TauT family transport system permease protein [Halospina denitrificans]|uniref:NitT/TauT family transport system permease protein n=1 Tax=Halospina denitrificans TaxID=332522 RepID=A0A4V6Q2I9_9GAMM|nr:ABC transporter permease subunit [Halospina denitrificans]TDT38598.1 NitT/TauT family transport system permease protein [Halospina denitrificans]
MKKFINRHPNQYGRWVLGILPFVLLLILYVAASNARLAENPNDPLLPSLMQMGDAIQRMAFEPSKRTGEYLMLQDTLASLQRIGIGVGVSALIGLIFGIANGAIPYIRATLSPLIVGVSLVPPMAILPILFIIFGLEELAKVMLIIVGITPFLIRDLQQRTLEIPEEQIIKMQTLGANTWQIVTRLALPQIMPRLLATTRLALGTAWIFLIAAEAIAATEGLGYRIFLVRRYLSMDVILPYVMWITLLALMIDFLLARISRWRYPWFHASS